MSDSDPAGKLVNAVRGMSEVITTHGMAPASFSCGVLFAFYAVFRYSGAPNFTTYGGIAVGSVLMIVGILLHVWKVAREKPRAFPAPPPLDPQFVETLKLLRNLAARGAFSEPVPPLLTHNPDPPPDVTSEDDGPEQ
jgi:hypothetical protein